jgi:hypothetical protein
LVLNNQAIIAYLRLNTIEVGTVIDFASKLLILFAQNGAKRTVSFDLDVTKEWIMNGTTYFETFLLF